MRLAAAVLILVGLAAWPFIYDQPFYVHMGVMMGLWVALALSMNLMLRIGQLSFAHGAFMGLGAYASALATMRLGIPFPIAFLSGGLAAASVAALVGPIFLRIRGVYFALLTFAFGEVVVLTFVEWVEVFGGNNGLFGIPKPSLFGLQMTSRPAFYLFALTFAVLSFIAVRAIYNSQFGAVITSIDDNEMLTRSIGIDAPRYRLAAFCFSAALAGWSGAFYAHYLTFISPEAFGFWTPVNMVVINVLGGIASPWGPVVGALLLVPLPEILRDAKEYQVLSYGILLMIFLLFLPDGLVGLARRWRGRWRAARSAEGRSAAGLEQGKREKRAAA
ncbi:MAG: branched-chain amino acid ABC transporter permease [Hyphomicrobiaceae bacterium]|nr:branched-chain amino acid ABC transporter permease [Hyphomicrobiaceae bacterium]